MKVKNKNKYIITALTTVSFASVLGSVAGTVAWYQYSTRATANYLGTSASTSENLQVLKSVKGDTKKYGTDVTVAEVKSFHHEGYSDGSELVPVTTGEQAKDVALDKEGLYAGSTYQHFNSNGPRANKNKYVQFDLNFHVLDGANPTGDFLEKNLYLTDLTIEERNNSGKKDISTALRVQFSCGDTNMLFSKSDAELDVFGKLDLNGDGEADDTYKYDYQRQDAKTAGGPISYGTYGVDGKKQTTYLTSDKTVIATEDDNGLLTDVLGVTPLGKTKASEDLTVTVTIWLEGWEKFESAERADWKESDYLGANFAVGMSFGVEPQA